MKLYPFLIATFTAAGIFFGRPYNGTAQTYNYHTEAGIALAQIDKELAETQQQKADADAAAAAAGKEAADARKQANDLRAQRAKAKTDDDRKAFDGSIAQAEADAARASAEAQKHFATARERLLHQAQLQFERPKYEQKVKQEEEDAKNRAKADKLNNKRKSN